MKAETLEKELERIAADFSRDKLGIEFPPDGRARANLFREVAGPRLQAQAALALELRQRMLKGEIPRERALMELIIDALDRGLGRAAISVDARISGMVAVVSGSELARAWREQLEQPPIIESPKSAISEILVVSPIPPIVPPSPSGAEVLASSASTPQELLSADASNHKQPA